jgi:hypothetical protein
VIQIFLDEIIPADCLAIHTFSFRSVVPILPFVTAPQILYSSS